MKDTHDAAVVIELATIVATFYKDMLEWSIDIVAIDTEPDFAHFMELYSAALLPVIVFVRGMGGVIMSRIENWLLFDSDQRDKLKSDLVRQLESDSAI